MIIVVTSENVWITSQRSVLPDLDLFICGAFFVLQLFSLLTDSGLTSYRVHTHTHTNRNTVPYSSLFHVFLFRNLFIFSLVNLPISFLVRDYTFLPVKKCTC